MRGLPFAVIALALTSAAALHSAPVEITNAAQPQLTVGHDGRIWLAYGHYTEPAPAAAHAGHGTGDGKKKKGHQPPPRTGEVFVTRSNDGGTTFQPASKVASVPKLMLGNRRGPRIAAHGDQLTVTVIAHELLAFNSRDGGASWSEPVVINRVPTSAREGLHDLAAAPNGDLFVTWLDLRNGAMELWGASSSDGGRTWRDEAPVYRSPEKSICECCHPGALFDAEGNLAVMWRNSIGGARDMWLATRPVGANRFGAPRKLGEGSWQLNACPMDGGRLVALGGGRFGAVWQRAGEVFLTADSGAEQRIGQGRQPVAIALAGKPVIAWQQDTALLVKTAGAEAKKRADEARFPSLVAVPNSGALLAYERGPAKGPTSVVVERL